MISRAKRDGPLVLNKSAYCYDLKVLFTQQHSSSTKRHAEMEINNGCGFNKSVEGYDAGPSIRVRDEMNLQNVIAARKFRINSEAGNAKRNFSSTPNVRLPPSRSLIRIPRH